MLYCRPLLAFGLLSALAAAQDPPMGNWMSDAEQASAQAQKSNLPMAFYLTGPADGGGATDTAQQQALHDPRVVQIIHQRFVPVRLRPSVTTETLLEQMKASGSPPFTVFVTSPRGRLVGSVPPETVAKPEQLAAELMKLFDQYGTELFERVLKPTLEDPATQANDLVKALDQIRALSITAADETTAALLKRKDLSDSTRQKTYETLADLSTQASVAALFEAALADPAGAQALKNCQPSAAKQLLGELGSNKPQRMVLAYETVVSICAVQDAKPQQFWTDADKEEQGKEIARITEAVNASARPQRDKTEAQP